METTGKKKVKKRVGRGRRKKRVAPAPQQNLGAATKMETPKKTVTKKGGRKKKKTAQAPQHYFRSISRMKRRSKKKVKKKGNGNGGGNGKTVAPVQQHNFREEEKKGREDIPAKTKSRPKQEVKKKERGGRRKKSTVAPVPQQEKTEKPVIAGRKRRVSVSGRKRRVSLSQHHFDQEKTGRQRRVSVSGRKRRVSLSQHNFSQEKTGRQRRNSVKIDFGAERKRRMSAPQHNFETGNTDSGRTRRMSSFVHTSKDRTRRKSFREEFEEVQHRQKKIDALSKQIKVRGMRGSGSGVPGGWEQQQCRCV